MGAWIETVQMCHLCGMQESHPIWVRGLKLETVGQVCGQKTVAPYMGAWIETNVYVKSDKKWPVAPYMGAWIETLW